MKLKKILPATVSILSLSLASCVSMSRNFLGSSVTGYTNEQQAEAMKTLDPSVSYSPRTGIVIDQLGKTVEKMKSAPPIEASQAPQKQANMQDVRQFKVVTAETALDAYIIYPSFKKYSTFKEKKYPVIFFCHGGGFTGGSFAGYEPYLRKLANECDAAVFYYDYRLAPEHKFPTQVNDTYNALTFLLTDEDVAKMDLDLKNMVLIGDSAGGNLAEGLAIHLMEDGFYETFKGVVLLYPNLDVSDRLNYSRIVFGGLEGRYYVCNLENLINIENQYLTEKADAYKPYASPLIMMEGLMEVEGYNNDNAQYKAKLTLPLTNYPEHFIAVAEIDTLRDEAKSYAALLTAFGAKCTLKQYDGMFHGFATMYKSFNAASRCFDDTTKFINRVLEPGKKEVSGREETEVLSISSMQKDGE